MSNTSIQIKRSLTTNTPVSLNIGEPAYSYSSNTLFIGTPNENDAIAIGGHDSYLRGISAYDHSNSAFILANAASLRANNSLDANTGGVITGDVTIQGNLSIIGGSIGANVPTVLIGDNIITLNTAISQSGQPTMDAGIEIDRGAQPNVYLLWNETDNKWTFTNDGTNYDDLGGSSASSYANAAFLKANAAYDNSNTRVSKSGDRMTGSLEFFGPNLAIGNYQYPGGIDLWANTDAAYAQVNYANTNYLYVDPLGAALQSPNAQITVFDTDGIIEFYSANVDSGNKYWRLYSNGEFVWADGTSQNTSPYAAGQYANAAFVHANAAFAAANNVFPQVQPAYDTANAAFIHANSAYQSQNATGNVANAAFIHANAAFIAANNVFPQVQPAFNTANAAFIHANSGFIKTNSAFDHANAAFANANGAFAAANAAFANANGAFAKSNAAYNHANSGFIQANASFNHANAGFIRANNSLNANTGGQVTGDVVIVGNLTSNTLTTTGSNGSITGANAVFSNYFFGANGTVDLYAYTSYAFANANGAFAAANGAYIQANSAFIKTNSAFDHANAAYISQNATGQYANSAFIHANSAFIQTNSAFDHANASYTSQNATGQYANAAFINANSAFIQANASFDHANAAYISQNATGQYANAAFVRANNSLDANNGGTVTANVIIAANLTTQNVYVRSYVDLNTAASKPVKNEGRLFYDNYEKSIAFYGDSDETLQIGQSFVRVWNDSGSTIDKGKVVRIGESVSANGFPAAVLASADISQNAEAIGFTITSIANNSYGYVLVSGEIHDIDTSLFNPGQELFLSTTPGEYVTTPPVPPNIPIAVGYILTSDITAGSLLVHIHLMEGKNKTDGAILFGRNGAIDQDPTKLYWDYVNDRLGIDTDSPQANIHVAGDGLFTGNLSILGNLVISNAQTITTDQLFVGGNTVILNSNTTGTPTLNAGIIVNRGDSPNAYILWDETVNEWLAYEGNGEPGHILISTKTANSWAAYSAFDPYEKETYPIGASLANSINEHAKAGFETANIAQDLAIAGLKHANSGFIHANSAFDHANSAYLSQNATGQYANAAFIQANAAFDHANSSYLSQNATGQYANAAFTVANNAFIHANSGFIHSNAAFIQSNLAFDHANAAYISQNATGQYANAAFIHANSAYESQNATGQYANAAFIQANASFDKANNADANALSAGVYANSSFIHANAAFAAANNVFPQVQPAYDTANSAFIQANASFDKANNADANAQSAGVYANSAYDHANAVFAAANNVFPQIQPAFNTANAAFIQANAAIVHAQSAFDAQNTTANYANSAFIQANAAYSDLNTVAVYANTPSYTANSAAIYANGAFTQANIANADAFSAGNYANAAFIIANSGFIQANSAFFHGNSAFNHANGAFDAANSGGIYANGAFATANSGSQYANSAFTVANGSFLHANSAYESQNSTGQYANAAFVQANAAIVHAQSAFDAQNTTASYTNSAFELANSAAIAANTPSDVANSAAVYANGAFAQANAAYNRANNSLNANTGGTVTGELITTGLIRSAASAGDEGGEFQLAIPQTNTTLSGPIAIDVYQNKLRFFETTGTNRGAFIDLTAAEVGVSSDLLAGGGGSGADQYARDTANAAFIHANSAFIAGNGTAIAANTPSHVANSASVYANGAFVQANAVFDLANGTAIAANTPSHAANSAALYANASFIHANAAFDSSNTKFSSSGGTISGNVTIQNDLSVLGNVTFVGNVTSLLVTGNSGQFFGYAANGFNALYAGIPVGYDFQPQTIFQASGNVNDYSQINIQNINSGDQSSSDYVATADNGTEDDTYIDMGIGSSTHADPDYTLVGPNDGYLYVSGNTVTGGGDLVIGTFIENDIVFAVGGMGVENEQMRIIGTSNTINIRANVDTSLSKSVLLGPIANVHITGGTDDDYIRTDGAGNLSFASLTSANVIKVLYDTANASFITANTPSDVANSAALYSNGAFIQANAAFIRANNSLDANNGGTVTANVIISANLQAANVTTNTYIQFGDGTRQYTANAGSGGGGGGGTVDSWSTLADGINSTFTMSFTPTANAGVVVSIGGIVQSETYDYLLTPSNSTISFNAPPPQGERIRVAGFSNVTPTYIDAANSAGATINTFEGTGDGSTQIFNLGFDPISDKAIFVSLGGILQPESAYSVNSLNNTISFVDAPQLNESIRVVGYSRVNPYYIQYISSNVSVSVFETTANGAQTSYQLGFNPQARETLIVTIDGIVQPISSYTVDTGTYTITFDETPASGELVRVATLYTTANAFIVPDGSISVAKLDPALNSTLQSAATTGKAIAMSIVFGG